MTDAPQLPAPVEDEENLGPAMQILTPKMRAFVRAYASGMTQAQAYGAAGYSTASANAVAVSAHQLAHHPKVQTALYEESLKAFRTDALMARRVLVSIASDTAAKQRDRIVACVAILDRGGFGSTSTHRVDVHHHEPSRAEVVARLAAACDELGFTPEMKQRALRVKPVELTEQPDGSFAADTDGSPDDTTEKPEGADNV
jgi:phage terminase small subunit